VEQSGIVKAKSHRFSGGLDAIMAGDAVDCASNASS
jgi:hypothetical protein